MFSNQIICKERYTEEEVKKKFNYYLKDKPPLINNQEFNLLCKAIHIVPKRLVDKLDEHVYFVPLSGQKNNVSLACTFFLETKIKNKKIKNKKAIIIITPIVFGSCNCIQLWPEEEQLKRILHEIAHYDLDHKEYRSLAEYRKFEKQADAKVKEWIRDWRVWGKKQIQKLRGLGLSGLKRGLK